jgi:hypothetical protein
MRGKIYADRTLQSDDSDDEGLGVLALFARINLFEEIVDYYNRCMANDARLSPIAREINRIHHVEEMRHLSFGRHFLRHNLDQAVAQRDDAWHQRLREHLQAYLEFVWKQYYNPDVYADAGIPDAFAAWRDTRNAACTVSHRDKINRKRLSYLRKLGLLESM